MVSGKWSRLLVLILFVLLLQLPLDSPTGLAAGPWYVAPDGNDGNNCLSPAAPCRTIQGAVDKASSDDTVFVAIGTYSDGGNEYGIVDIRGKSITLSGGWDRSYGTQSGYSTVDGQNARRGIAVAGNGTTAAIERFIVEDCYSNDGGGIYNYQSTLTLNNCMIRNNSTAPVAGHGIQAGGIYNEEGNLIINDSSITGNIADENAGGMHIRMGATYLNNVTIAGNQAGMYGGAICASPSGVLTLNNCTISDNWAGLGGGGIYVYGVSILIQNSILADNTTDRLGPNCLDLGYIPIVSQGYNLFGDTTHCPFTPSTGDLLDEKAGLISTADWLGYNVLQAGSPAVNAGNPAGCTNHLGNPLGDR